MASPAAIAPPETDRTRRVPEDVNAKLIEAGFHRFVQPPRFGRYDGRGSVGGLRA